MWLYNDYLASLLTIIVGVIVFFVLVIALISEWLEPSRVPKWYFQIMAASLAALLLAAGIYLLLFGANMGISKEI